jgi:hypothetical protein
MASRVKPTWEVRRRFNTPSEKFAKHKLNSVLEEEIQGQLLGLKFPQKEDQVQLRGPWNV